MRSVKNAVFIPGFFKLKMPTKTENLLSWLESASPSPQPVETLLQLKRRWKLSPKKSLSPALPCPKGLP